jgi:hypothetical protein
MNLTIVLFMLFGAANEPRIFLYSGKTLMKLEVVTVPNVGTEVLKLLVESPYELKSALLDSSDVKLCLPTRNLMAGLNLKGRWYVINWRVKLTVGSERHTILLICRSGRTYKKTFVINTEGNMRLNKPQWRD